MAANEYSGELVLVLGGSGWYLTVAKTVDDGDCGASCFSFCYCYC